MKDRILIFTSSALRGCSVSLSGVILALYLSSVGFQVPLIGLTVSLGLIGAAAATLLVVLFSERLGKKEMLASIGLLRTLGGLVFVFFQNPSVLIPFAVIGMMNGMGRDRSASLSIEQAILPSTSTDAKRTRVFAWYNVVSDAGHALGAALGFLPAFFRIHLGLSVEASYQWTWGIYSAISFLSGVLVLGLSAAAVAGHAGRPAKLTSASRSIITRFSWLTGLDSLGGGFLTTALVSYWFFKRFGVDESVLGPLFFFARLANMFSHLGAAWLAERIGLVNTMVFTHIPSSLLLMTIPFMPNLPVAMILFLLRESLVEMDVPTRQSYLMAVVKPHERVRAAGISNLTRGAAWGIAPAVAGELSAFSLSLPLFIGPGLKILYDLLLFREFRKIKPPEEASVNPLESES